MAVTDVRRTGGRQAGGPAATAADGTLVVGESEGGWAVRGGLGTWRRCHVLRVRLFTTTTTTTLARRPAHVDPV